MYRTFILCLENNYMHTIKSITVDIILDSRGNPTLSVSVFTDTCFSGNCMVPSGASVGKYEAYEMRDNGQSNGGVINAKEIILTKILPTLLGKNIEDQHDIDHTMITLDGTSNKQVLGGNSMIGVSIACAKAAAKVKGQEFYEYLKILAPPTSFLSTPRLYLNLINGGKHTLNNLAFQEYHIVPMVDSIIESLAIAKTIQEKLGEIVKEKYGIVKLGDEGGYAIAEDDVEIPLALLRKAVVACGFTDKIMFALDVAATSFYDEEKGLYIFSGREYSKDTLRDFYLQLAKEYSFISIEDPFFEEDFESFSLLQKMLPNVCIVGDDLTVTNCVRLKQAIEEKSVKGIIIKPNQIGTLSETIDAITHAQNNGIKCIVSHRSGETNDDMIADITMAFNCFGMKGGARGQEVREAKYTRLALIESLLNKK